ncbi:hypothetical protein [Paraliobacillus sp. X-1268]|uniref:hypothetical protein n=1 Tax=Paraliobacillus sp. X-1268 TaxID=2213193 RepID=UPI000E3C0157|nr:hypothetical protein [Paraliobacillus sp. X-1268]
MDLYQIKNMIIDDEQYSEESITVDFTNNNKRYSITLNKADLEVVNTWVFENNTSIPASLPDEIIKSIREDVKKQIN